MSFTSSFAHLDGVEFRLSDALQVAHIEGLPANFRIKDPTRLLLESEYDFSKEHEALASIHAKRRSEQKMREAEAVRKRMSMKRRDDKNKMLMDQQKEILQRQRELFLEQKRRQQQEKVDGENKLPEGASPDQTSSSRSSPLSDDSREDTPPPIPPKTYLPQLKNDDILTPLPAAPKPQGATDLPGMPSTGNQIKPAESVSTSSNQIWDDFEDKEQDPFTNMELKTIDDMKELQSVLQNATLDPPSYIEATSNTQVVTTTTEVPSITEEPASTSSNPPYPFYADVAEISTKLKTIVMAKETSSAPTSGQNSNSSSLTDVNQNYEHRKSPTLERDKEPEGPTNGSQSGSPVFDISSNNDEIGKLYENVTVIENTEGHFKFKTAEPIGNSGATSAKESVYDYAKDPGTPAASQPLPKSPMEPVTQHRLSPVSVMYGNLGRQEQSSDEYTKIVRPRRRAPKAPDQDTPSSPTPQVPSIPSPTNRPKQSTGQNKLVISGSNWSGTGRSSPNVSSSNQSKPDVTTRALPVSFGLVNNSISTSILPPITSNSSLVESNYVNVTRTSISDSGLNQGPPIPPRRGAREAGARGPAAPTSTTLTPAYPVNPRAPPPGGYSNGAVPTTGGSTATSGSHHYPPYAMPPAQSTTNGPTIAIKSNSSVSFSNLNPGSTRPTLPPRRTSPVSPTNPTDATFIKKSLQDRARFEETMNRALRSLPKSPAMKPVITHKPTSPPPHDSPANMNQAFSSYAPLPSKPRSPSPKTLLLQSLSPPEREFVSSIISMGFDVEATVRAAQNLGCNAKEVVDHLIIVQRISEQGFSPRAVQDALQIYKEDNQITKYLHQASQLLDMGFAEGDVKNALVSNDNDQTKALDQLMGQT